MRHLIAIACVLFIGSATAIEPPKQDKPPASTETPPTAPAPDAPVSAEPEGTVPEPVEPEDEEETLPPLPADAAPAGPPPARFNPTEKVRADFPVSFPIDI